MDIPNYPNVCRVCLTDLAGIQSIPVESTVQRGLSYLDVFEEVCSISETNVDEELLPKYMCLSCSGQLANFKTFKTQSIANKQVLDDWVQQKFVKQKPIVIEQLQQQNDINTNMIDDTSAVANPIKTEIESMDNFPITTEILILKSEDPNQDEEAEMVDLYGDHEPNGEPPYEIEQENIDDDYGDAEHLPVEHKKRPSGPIQIIGGVHHRSCFLNDCAPVPVGQADKHAKKCHRSYCKICGLVFPSQAQAVLHLKVHKSSEDRHFCELCQKPFWRVIDLKIHMRSFHGVKVATFECSYCEMQFEKREDIAEHRKTHLSCKFCSKQFDNHFLTFAHVRRSHKDKLVSCQQCSMHFIGQKEYLSHMEKHRDNVQEKIQQFVLKHWTEVKCIPCDRLYYNQEYLLQHMTNDHTNGIDQKPARVMNIRRRTQEELDLLEYKFQCKECKVRFRLSATLRNHRKVAHGGVQFICEFCGSSFKAKGNLIKHERYKHTKEFPFACEFCDKRCNTRRDLDIHRRSHTNEKPYVCQHEGCTSAYKTQSALVKHNRSHTGEKPYKCSYVDCDKAYVCSQMLKVHLRNHTMEKPFKCWYCELHFNSTNNRVKHCKRHHVGMPYGREVETLNREASS